MSDSYFKKQRYLIGVHIIILMIAIAISLLSGRYRLSFRDIMDIFGQEATTTHTLIFWEIRLPRTIVVCASGAALALAGTALQKMFNNPLASPDIIGITSGCSVGAAIGIVFLGGAAITIQSMSFVTGMIAMGLALLLAGMMRTNKTLGLVIAGIITGALSTSLIMIMKYLADPVKQLPSIEYWLMGGFYHADWGQVFTVVPIVIVGTVFLILLGWQLQILSLGQEQAAALGVEVKRLQLAILLITTLMVSSVVSTSGLISWIGLIAPHIVKMYCKEGILYHLPLSALTGASLMLFADTIAKTMSANEVPVSIVTTLLGAPILFYLARRMKQE
ncbi:MAG: iron ABC transporter permease [Lachnospiraceae bacterium]